MKNPVFQKALLVVSMFFLISSLAAAQHNRPRRRSRSVRPQVESQTKSFLIRNFSAGEITLDASAEPRLRRTVQKVPEHIYPRVPKGPQVPNKYASPAIKLLDFRSEPSVVNNVVVLPGGGLNNQVSEPTVAVKGNLIFYTANHFAAFSTDGGSTYSYVSPWDAFDKATSGRYSFCCDQEVHYVPQIDMFVWSLQADDYAAQLLLYASPDNVRRNKWTPILFTPDNLEEAGKGLDYTDLSFGNNMLYWSTNVFIGEDPDESVVVRIPLEGLRTGHPLPQASKRRVFVRLVQNTGDAGYFAAHIDTSSLYVYKWEETASDPTWKKITVPSWNRVSGDWGSVGSRIVGATRAGNELWLAWNANQRGTDRPQKYAQVARIDTGSFTLIDSPDVWSPDFRIGIPALASNNSNEVGISYIFGRNHNHGVGLLTGTRVFFTTSEGEFDAVGYRWGDYLSIRQQYNDATPSQPTGLFAATGYTIKSGSVIEPRLIMFSRNPVP